MKIFRSLALIAAVAMVAFASVADTVVSVARNVFDYGANLVMKLVAGPEPTEDTETSPAVVGIVKAKAFVLRLVKRERPQISPSWRMCPST